MSKKQELEQSKVWAKNGEALRKIGVYTVDDLIHYYPRGYEILENRFQSVKWRKEKSARSVAVFLGVYRFLREKEDRSRLHI